MFDSVDVDWWTLAFGILLCIGSSAAAFYTRDKKGSFAQVVGGLAMVSTGFTLLQIERKKPKPERRQWLIVMAFALMFVGTIFGLGIGDFFLASGTMDFISNAFNR